jgi:hypothetical protein
MWIQIQIQQFEGLRILPIQTRNHNPGELKIKVNPYWHNKVKRDIGCDFVLQDCDGLQQGACEGGGTSRQQSLHLSRGIWLNMAYTVKKVTGFPSPAGVAPAKLSLAGNNKIIFGQLKFGKWHPGWGRENR